MASLIKDHLAVKIANRLAIIAFNYLQDLALVSAVCKVWCPKYGLSIVFVLADFDHLRLPVT